MTFKGRVKTWNQLYFCYNSFTKYIAAYFSQGFHSVYGILTWKGNDLVEDFDVP